MDRLNDIEPSEAECEFLATIREVLEEAEYDPGKNRSLAAGVARTWSFLLQDVSANDRLLFCQNVNVC